MVKVVDATDVAVRARAPGQLYSPVIGIRGTRIRYLLL